MLILAHNGILTVCIFIFYCEFIFLRALSVAIHSGLELNLLLLISAVSSAQLLGGTIERPSDRLVHSHPLFLPAPQEQLLL